MSRDCEHCQYSVPDPAYKGPARWSYATCSHPQTREGARLHFCSTCRKPYGACAAGQHFSARPQAINCEPRP